MRKEVRWERMFPDELEQRFADCPLVYFTYGLAEPHGPHCAVGLDGIKAYEIACEAARTHGGIVAPPDYWHIHELSGYAPWSHRMVGQVERSWLTAMPPWQHFRNVCYHIRTAEVMGFEGAILLTGHYGPNWQDLKTLVELVQPHAGTRLYSLPDWEANQPGFDNDGNSGGDHAGKVETSLLWALEPESIDLSRIPADVGEQTPFAMGRNCREANRLVGARMVADEVAYLGERGRELLAAYREARPAHTLRTYADVERLWATVVAPELGSFRTMQDLWEGSEEVPEDSVWHENWRVPPVTGKM